MAGKSGSNLPALRSPGLSPRSHPYGSSISSPASSSSSSLFSVDAPSSHSSDGSSSARSPCAGWENENENETECSLKDGSYRPSAEAWKFHDPSDTKYKKPGLEVLREIAVPTVHPRRTSRKADEACARSLLRPPPPLVRQCERKESFVDSLVGKLVTRLIQVYIRCTLNPYSRYHNPND